MKRQSEFLPELDEALRGIRGLIATSLEQEQGLSRRQLKYIKRKIHRAFHVINENVTSIVTSQEN